MLASWIGVDTHGPTSAYIVGDSRFSWSGTGKYFDYGKKVFASNLYPEIFGYAGDVLFPSTVLSQIIEMIDQNILFNDEMDCEQKNKIVFEKLCHSFSKYPSELGTGTVQVLHITRDTQVVKYPGFKCFSLFWTKAKGWLTQAQNIPETSGLLCVLGSGKVEFSDNYSRYQKGLNRGTSRSIFHCFIDTLFSTTDPACGGPPQLVGIYRKPNSSAKNFGIIYQNHRYFLGAELPSDTFYDKVEWRNELFELCDGRTMQKLEGAMKQPDLLRRK